MSQIHTSLDQCYLRDRIIFWYDPEGEWTDEYESYVTGDVERLTLSQNEFGIKNKVLSHPDQAARFLIYSKSERPPDEKNWLLDLLLQGHEFKADRTSMNLQEFGLSYDFSALFKEHEAFFSSEKSKQELTAILSVDETEETLRLKMLAVLAGTKTPEIDSMLLEMLQAAIEHQDDELLESPLVATGLDHYFWRSVKERFGYSAPTPSIRDFAVALFRYSNPLDDSASPLHSHAQVFLQRWKDSSSYSPAFRIWSQRFAQEFNLKQQIEDSNNPIIGPADAFEIFDQYEIHRLAAAFLDQDPDIGSEIKNVTQTRRLSIWFEDYRHAYHALVEVVRLRELVQRVDFSIISLNAGIKAYTATWWKIDQCYRKATTHLRCSQKTESLTQVSDWLNHHYVEQFLLPLSDSWSDIVAASGSWVSDTTSQNEFYQRYVIPFLDKKQKPFVIISDAFRYEIAEDLASRLNTENRYTAKTEPMLAMLPSYTQLGMAALLPGQTLEIEPHKGTVVRDGLETAGTENRAKILKRHLNERGTAIPHEAFMNLNKSQGRDLMKGNDVVYIYHNTIDKTGDDRSSEGETFDAVEKALGELTLLVKRITSFNGSNILITADHGFIFQQKEIHQTDDVPRPAHLNLLNKNRRFLIGDGFENSPATINFKSSQLGLAGSSEYSFPRSLGRFCLQGSGKRFVHGGFSLQEVIIPVLAINKARSNDVGQVEIDIMRVPPKITTGRFSISLFQKSSITSKLHSRRVQVGLYSLTGEELSEIKTIDFDSTEVDARLREFSLDFVLSHTADRFNNTTVEIRLANYLPNSDQIVPYKKHALKLQKHFDLDF